MSCYMYEHRRKEFKNKMDQVAQDVAALESKMSGDLSEIAAQIFARLDVMEQAITDPDGPAASSLRKKHGIGKKQPTKPLSRISKQKTL